MSEKEICRSHCNGGEFYEDADCYVCNMQEEIAALKESRKVEMKAYDELQNAFIDLNLELDEHRERIAELEKEGSR